MAPDCAGNASEWRCPVASLALEAAVEVVEAVVAAEVLEATEAAAAPDLEAVTVAAVAVADLLPTDQCPAAGLVLPLLAGEGDPDRAQGPSNCIDNIAT